MNEDMNKDLRPEAAAVATEMRDAVAALMRAHHSITRALNQATGAGREAVHLSRTDVAMLEDVQPRLGDIAADVLGVMKRMQVRSVNSEGGTHDDHRL